MIDPRRTILQLLLNDPLITNQLDRYEGHPAVFRGLPTTGYRLARGAQESQSVPFSASASFSDGAAFAQWVAGNTSRAVIILDTESFNEDRSTLSNEIHGCTLPVRIYARDQGDDAPLSSLAFTVRKKLHKKTFPIFGGTLGSCSIRGPQPLLSDEALIDGRILYADLTIEED